MKLKMTYIEALRALNLLFQLPMMIKMFSQEDLLVRHYKMLVTFCELLLKKSSPQATILPVNCSHGFFIRGDLSDPEVQTCVDIVMEEFTTFLVENVLQIASGAPSFFTKYWISIMLCYFLSV